ncbi:hypothetical protein [Dyadobacter arcticus]|uniref:SnoaL-like domain-containing protein n=1 Tax=Dyadobacter arcticus TaxID=1078754 RepID=A0ABX0ULF1_9BACT|nr:hypothetical protein [Dyadobacter arcticus]NIJ53824.1 hypothetical protein [Dyadobacter arcticus]
MKTSLLFLFASTLLFSCQPKEQKSDKQTQQSSFDEKAETAAIMKVIDNETKCFFDGNYECWASNWVHEKYAMQEWNNDAGSYDAAIGWDKINQQGKSYIEKYYKNGKNVVHPQFKRETPQVKFFGENAAYLIWKQYNTDQENKFFLISQDTRIMEKQADGWKIVNVTSLWDSKTRIPIDSIK